MVRRPGRVDELGDEVVELVAHLIAPGDVGPGRLDVPHGEDLAHEGDPG